MSTELHRIKAKRKSWYIDSWNNISNLVSYSAPNGEVILSNSTSSATGSDLAVYNGSSMYLYKNMRKDSIRAYSIYAPHSGAYEFSFIWQCTTLDRLCSWSFETLQDGEWINSESAQFFYKQ